MQSNETTTARPRALAAVACIELLSLALWIGGLAVLGAIVAPTVFRVVPAPTSADAMTLVFRRFDRVAMGAAAVSLVAEGALARIGGKVTRLDVARAGALALAAALAMAVGAYLSPAIADLHARGAIRGLGHDGLALERVHRLAEAAAKTELALVIAVLVALAIKLTAGGARSARAAHTRGT